MPGERDDSKDPLLRELMDELGETEVEEAAKQGPRRRILVAPPPPRPAPAKPKVSKRGRPELPREQRRSEHLDLTFTPLEMKDIQERAARDDAAIPLREWARRILLNPENKP